ncbi:hypothetical protein N7497_009973 [Penicillium chrysogenum]|nr:hypothetical protein N7524_007023 [Penicillium chrysogenum]KAJ6147991.1 hypothetical protein N7497_009973 [Penicillium chrysogenum]
MYWPIHVVPGTFQPKIGCFTFGGDGSGISNGDSFGDSFVQSATDPTASRRAVGLSAGSIRAQYRKRCWE